MLTPEIPGVEIQDELGSGGFSVVYRAEQSAFGRTVAAKVLALDPDDTPVVQAFMAEARNIGELAARPDVVTVYETGLTTDGRPYLLLQYLAGGTLAERLRQNGPLSVTDALLVGVTIARVLVAAHERGVLHCDLKPANVLFDADDRPVLADFGIARLTAAADSSRSMAFLTPDHAAPELWEGRPPSVSTDLYALGSTMYQVLVGQAPFQDATGERLPPLQVMRRVLAESPPPIVRPDVPAPLTELIMQLLAKQPEHRPADAATVVQALTAAGAPEVVQAPVVAGPDPSRSTSSEWVPPPPDDDRTRRRVSTAPDIGVVVGSMREPSSPTAVGVSPPLSEAPQALADQEVLPDRRALGRPAAVGVGVLVAAIAGWLVFTLLRTPETRPAASTTTTESTIVADAAPVLSLAKEVDRIDGARVLTGTITGAAAGIVSIEVVEQASPGVPSRSRVGWIYTDSQNPMRIVESTTVEILATQMLSTESGVPTPLPDRPLCFTTMPEDGSPATTACDAG